MAHLFIASKVNMANDPPTKGAPKAPKSADAAATATSPDQDRPVVVTTTAAAAGPLIHEARLSAATGGADVSCQRCAVPFGVVVLVAGVVVTAVAYAFNSHGSTISVLGLVLLSAGLVLLGSSAVCRRLRTGKKKRDRRRESQTALMAGQGPSVA